MKKIISLFTSLVMAFSLLGVMPVMGAGTILSGNYEYDVLADGTVEIVAYTGSATDVTIPSTIGGKTVTSIGDWAFHSCDSLTSITIPDSVTSIGSYAFYWCESLTSITIPDSVTSIGDGAFAYCDSLTSITIPDSVTSIGDVAFEYCESLTSITIPDSVTSIGDGAFSDCDSLTSVTIGNGVTSIGDYAFSDCYSLTSVTIPDSVTSIGDYAFYGCKSLTSVTIPDGVTSIGDFAFYGCKSLTSVTIPDGVTSIGWFAFEDCNSLTSINVNANNKYYSSVDGVLFNKNKTKLIQYPIGNKRNSYTIPDSVTSIGYDAFYGCGSLTSITIPDSVTSIGDYAFEYCDNLTIKCYENSVAHQYAIDNDIAYELLSDETQLEGKVYCQFKDNNTMMRFIAEVDIEDVTNANSGEITLSINGEAMIVHSITNAYRTIYSNGQVISAGEGNCFIISNSITGFASGDVVGVTCTLDNYDLGVSREVTIA